MMQKGSYCLLKPFLSTVSVKALNSSSRLILAHHLDCKHILLSQKGFARDYRGLAEQIGFPYHTIKKLEESKDRTLQILEEWETRPDATLDQLIHHLEEMDRYDAIEEFILSLRGMFKAYIEYQNSLLKNFRFLEGCDVYDAYVCYANEDSNLAQEIAQRLEFPRNRLKVFMRGRDRLAESCHFEFIKNKCRFMLVLLTDNFMKSPALEFLDSFAGTLDIETKQSTLIPIILEHSEMPPVLNDVPVIDFSKESKKDCKNLMWDSLIISLLPSTSDAIPSSNRHLAATEVKALEISILHELAWNDTNHSFLNPSTSFERSFSCKKFHRFIISSLSDSCRDAFDVILLVY